MREHTFVLLVSMIMAACCQAPKAPQAPQAPQAPKAPKEVSVIQVTPVVTKKESCIVMQLLHDNNSWRIVCEQRPTLYCTMTEEAIITCHE